MQELEAALVENKDDVNKLIAKTNNFFKTKKVVFETNKDVLNNSADRKIYPNMSLAETSRLSASSERKSKVIISPDFKSIDIEEKPCDLTKINKVPNTSINNTLNNNNILTDNSLIVNNIDESFKSTYSNGNLQHNPSMNNRLLEKIKSIKKLEGDVKERNSIIDKLNLKIEKQSQEIERLNSKLKKKKNMKQKGQQKR